MQNIIIAILLLCLTALANSQQLNTRGGIHLVNGFVPPPSGGTEMIHTIEFLGNPINYTITPDAYAKHLRSSATCGKVTINEKDYAQSPCATTVKEHDQIFTITCNQGNNYTYADIQFIDSGEATISGNGTIWGGFTTDQTNTLQLVGGPDNQLKAKSDDVGVVLNCFNNKRELSDTPSSHP